MTPRKETASHALAANGVAAVCSLALATFWLVRTETQDYGLAGPWMSLWGGVFAICAVLAAVIWVSARRKRRTSSDESTDQARWGAFFGLMPFGLLGAWWVLQTFG